MRESQSSLNKPIGKKKVNKVDIVFLQLIIRSRKIIIELL